MPARGCVFQLIDVGNKIARKRRLVVAFDAPCAVALQTVDVQRSRLREPRREHRIGCVAQILAGRPHEPSARGDIAVVVIVITDGDAAIAVAEIAWKADGVFVRSFLPYATSVRRRSSLRVTQYPPDRRHRQRREIECAGRRRPVGKKHPALLVESDRRDFGRAG
jgi:phosphoglycerate dehydrogenase-like enzyme